MSSDEVDSILALSGFKKGCLPIHYLGVPLISGLLSSKECSMVVDRITSRLRSWAIRALSYTGNLQLVNFILMSMVSYWCACFILPTSVID